jgi:hypothetical protein
MNGERYQELIEQVKTAKTQKEKIDFLATMVCMMATNDLDHLEKKIRKIYVMGVAILLAILFSDQISLTSIVGFVMKVMG